jgi:hypothetical protein
MADGRGSFFKKNIIVIVIANQPGGQTRTFDIRTICIGPSHIRKLKAKATSQKPYRKRWASAIAILELFFLLLLGGSYTARTRFCGLFSNCELG